jgi:putative transcriptional regulator
MKTHSALLLLICCAISSVFAADSVPGKGKLLVATEVVRGSDFQESVILLLHYDKNGATGLIVNKPLPAPPKSALPELEELERYVGNLYYGGPVGLNTIQALLRTSSPPDQSAHVIDDIYIVPINENLIKESTDSSTLRLYVGYAGWAPGQLDEEMLRGSWHIAPASGEFVFAADPENLWRKLVPPTTMRAAIQNAVKLKLVDTN